jgi:hypothetical protein
LGTERKQYLYEFASIFNSPETDSGSESLKLSCSASQAFHYSTLGMPEAATNPDPLAALTSSFKVITLPPLLTLYLTSRLVSLETLTKRG